MELSFVDYIGIFGAASILFAFTMNQLGKWKTTDFTYDITNVIGSGALVVYSFLITSYPFLVLNVVWLLVSLKDVLLRK